METLTHLEQINGKDRLRDRTGEDRTEVTDREEKEEKDGRKQEWNLKNARKEQLRGGERKLISVLQSSISQPEASGLDVYLEVHPLAHWLGAEFYMPAIRY